MLKVNAGATMFRVGPEVVLGEAEQVENKTNGSVR